MDGRIDLDRWRGQFVEPLVLFRAFCSVRRHDCDLTRGEVQNVLRDGTNVFHARRHPRATDSFSMSDGAAFTEVIPDLGGVLDELGIEDVVVRGPVIDRFACGFV